MAFGSDGVTTTVGPGSKPLLLHPNPGPLVTWSVLSAPCVNATELTEMSGHLVCYIPEAGIQEHWLRIISLVSFLQRPLPFSLYWTEAI